MATSTISSIADEYGAL